MLVTNFAFWLFWYQIRYYMLGIFTEDEDILNKGEEIFWLVLIFVFADFFQGAIYGFIKALNL